MTASDRDTAPAIDADLADLVERAERLAAAGGRHILGIVGAPGSGKSTTAAAIVREVGAAAVLVPMDGFHLANAELVRLGRRDRKGAPDTFDLGGYLSLLRRLRDQDSETVYAPTFDRLIDESIGSAIAIDATVPLVITEGNYLLLADGGWGEVAELLDETWYLDVPDDTRLTRLVNRRKSFGDPEPDALAWVREVDDVNSTAVSATRGRADLVVRLDSTL